MCGMGPERAEALCRRLETRVPPVASLALVGWAGGLDAGLAAGDILLANAALDSQGHRAPCTTLAVPGAMTGPMLTLPTPLLTPAQKDAWRASGAMAVEMEAYPLAAWAAARGLRFVHARVILDAPGETVPDLADTLDDFGRMRLGRLAVRLVAQPARIPSWLRFAQRAKTLAPVLAGLARLVATDQDALA